jgi:GT2 family glycosyltransferase
MPRISPKRSFVIPVLDFSPHSSYNINTLLADLIDVDGEVICIFNNREVFETLHSHKRIDKFCYNSRNAGVSRSWNIGINLSEADAVYILNADLHVKANAIRRMEEYLFSLDNAVLVGPQGSLVDYINLKDIHIYSKGNFQKPIRVHAVSGFFFCIHRKRFLDYKLSFDVRYSPCFMEEWDMGLEVIKAGLSSYVVPVQDYEHCCGVSHSNENPAINYFGRAVYRDDIYRESIQKFKKKWFS